jgi:hypothetical protein
MIRSIWALGAVLVCTGCTIPLKVHRVNGPAEKAKGVRYLLKRPAYDVALRFVAKDAVDPTRCTFAVLVSQTLDGDPLEFEASGEVQPFAETEIELTQEQDGTLSAFTAGAKDRTLEAIQTMVGIATTALMPLPRTKGAPRPPPPKTCGSEALEAHWEQHEILVSRLGKAQQALEHQLDSITPKSGSAKVRNIRELETLVQAREQKLSSHLFPLDRTQAHVKVGDRLVQGEGTQPWIIVTLTPVSP